MGRVMMRAGGGSNGAEAYDALIAGILGKTSITATTANTWNFDNTNYFDVTNWDIMIVSMNVVVNSGVTGSDRFALNILNISGSELQGTVSYSRSINHIFDLRSITGNIAIRLGISSQYSLNQTARLTEVMLYKLPKRRTA